MRYLLTIIGRSIMRHKGKTLISIFVCTALCLFLLLFTANIASIRQKLELLPSEVEINIIVTNVSAAKKSSLMIKSDDVDKIMNTGLVNMKIITARALYLEDGVEPLDPPKYMAGRENLVGAMNSEHPLLQSDEQTLTYMDGHNGSLLATDESVCLVRREYLEEKGLALGDTVSITLYTVYQSGVNDLGTLSSTVKYAGPCKLKIAGTFESYGDRAETMALRDTAPCFNFIVPYGFMRRFAEEQDCRLYPTSAVFTPIDPYRLNELKEKLQETGMLQHKETNSNTGGMHGNTLIINDNTFIHTAEPQQRRLSLLETVYPLCVAAVFLIAFLVSYLLIQSRRGEMAIFRSLGLGRLGVFFVMWAENLVLCILGSAAGLVITAIAAPGSLQAMLLAVALYAVAYLAGTAVSVLLTNRLDVLAVMSAEK